MTTPISPSDNELVPVIRDLRSANPTLGIPKFLALVLSENPGWTVSEKRFRKLLQREGLSLATGNAPSSQANNPSWYRPSSTINEKLDITKWSRKLEVTYFGKEKGKGLVAKERIEEGEVIWKEDPFILAPEWEIYDAQENSRACGLCSTTLTESNSIVSCSASTSSAHCPARFCNRLCYSRSSSTHPLLCPAQNPASSSLLRFARTTGWMAPHALARCTARVLLANEISATERDTVWEIIRSLAQMSMEDRYKNAGTGEPPTELWKKAYELYILAFKEPPTPQAKKKLSKILKKPLPAELESEFFTYEGFLRGLGRMSLNVEGHGGLYILHSHLNHSCVPNVSVRHLDQQKALARITVRALRDIEPGEELLITYVNPRAKVSERRRQLREWGFGECQCPRCLEDEKNDVKEEMDDLESELRTKLGL